MKSITRKAIALIAISAMLFSFSYKLGGEGFEISLNNKVIIQRYGTNVDDVQRLQLDRNSPNDKLTIRYHHCGKVGKNRIISIRDVQNKVIREWRYADAAEPVGPMTCNVKDILNIKNSGSDALKLYYSSSELPNGRLLAFIVAANNSVAKK